MWQLNLAPHQLSWDEGQWLGISGPSGCGKTQLLTQLATGHQAHLLRSEDNLITRPPKRRGIGWAAQGGLLWPAQQIERQLQSLAELHRVEWRPLADALGVRELLTRESHVLSGGERQRVALLSAMICAKDLLILDEPVSALDEHSALAVLHIARQWARERQLSALLVSHRQRDFEACCDKVYHWQSRRTMPLAMAHSTYVTEHPHLAAALWELDAAPSDGKVRSGRLTLETGPLPHHTRRIRIDAHDVSVARQPPGPSSIANTLQGTLGEITTVSDHSLLLSIYCDTQTLYSLVTPNAVQSLTLTTGITVYAQFKAHAVQPA
ncbi:ATP-binding cassette domain-containing protein [Gilvimarinus chinensis]|uniref:ATP-binding cassette domain-containing protein n=1 Tax=Gilvimarinus chinensis TaxID=396005 RepID=UPI00036EBC94|nr:ATP-binding cassette domain-containing protein [Gilvimarinus chinensis]